ncbi:ubiquinol-cytochrome c reductase iron-sulfur subunit [Malikia granosa]|uniref:Ubiquinol-cytochrome c reductase iron-sulfur subunit n=1 Tax=Malikia granosa TaxID=263067 RepID=A0A2S9K631_9BURK|nr:ubiquinol-cytochrome c reductase iron-sulfur subunit [Malikia granosa]PRD65864.1 ubiquinol-cytochrome c reductase iron-sulfur subunit [Malikia granosa]
MTSDLPLDEHARAQGIDVERRRWLTLTSMAGAAAAAATAVPFVSSFAPSERAKAAGASVEVDISSLAPGELKVVEWRGKPVWIMHRTPEQLAELEQIPGLADPASNRSDQPDYAKNTQRSIKPEVLVAVGICTHLGCSPVNVAKGSANPSVPADWPGGFFCPCHGSTFDLAGRVFANKPAPTNLEIPPHFYLDDSKLLIGEDQAAKA